MITVHTLTFNEELLMQFMIDHYRFRFPDCHIVIYDNQSTDRTVEIAMANHCEIRHFDSGGQTKDSLHQTIKNMCWTDSKTDWVLVCDLDEFLDITQEQLKQEEQNRTTLIRSECWHMVNLEDDLNIRGITHGYRTPDHLEYDKVLLFNKQHIKQINYSGGGHFVRPVGDVRYSKQYKMYHYQFINPDVFVAKNKRNKATLSEENLKNNWGPICLHSEPELRHFFKIRRDGAVKIRDLYNGSVK